jgi:hypothetical protein
MIEASTTTETWLERVSAWRASGERAEAFSRRGGYAASTLRWWASKLKRDLASAPAMVAVPEVRLARVIRSESAPTSSQAVGGREITLELVQHGIRIAVEAGADRATLAMVLNVLGVGAAR